MATYCNPILSNGADPFMTSGGGYYYYVETEVNEISVRRSRTITGLAQAERTVVYSPTEGLSNSKQIWAPELHRIDGRWFLYYTATTADENVYNHRMFALECVGDDPRGPYLDRGEIREANDKWAIDGTVLEMEDGQLIFIWSGFQEDNWPQKLYMAPLDRQEPWKLLGERILLTKTTLPWEGATVEGAQILRHDGKLMIVYSADDAGSDRYKLGLLTFTGEDPLNPDHWVKSQEPLFGTHEGNDVYSPGHCSFVKSPDGTEDWIVYHTAKRQGSGYDRQVCVQRFGWKTDGTPDFGIPEPFGKPLDVPSGE